MIFLVTDNHQGMIISFGSTETAPFMFILKGNQLEQRLMPNNYIMIYGRYTGIENREIDGKSFTIPVIEAVNINYANEEKYSINTIRNVAKYIWGDDIKITQPDDKPIYNMYGEHVFTEKADYCLVTLDNQSNANFKAFDMGKSNGFITYDKELNNLSESIEKRLFISADFQHFIVTTYDSNAKYVYIDYYDKSFNKLWGREYQYTSNNITSSPMDYNSNQMAFVIDNDLHMIDLESGENIIEPIIVGEKTKVIMMSDGIVLIGNENKDLVMKVDYDGKILYRLDGDTDLKVVQETSSQIVNGKLLLCIKGYNNEEELSSEYMIMKYMVINNDGTIEYSTKDIDAYYG